MQLTNGQFSQSCFHYYLVESHSYSAVFTEFWGTAGFQYAVVDGSS